MHATKFCPRIKITNFKLLTVSVWVPLFHLIIFTVVSFSLWENKSLDLLGRWSVWHHLNLQCTAYDVICYTSLIDVAPRGSTECTSPRDDLQIDFGNVIVSSCLRCEFSELCRIQLGLTNDCSLISGRFTPEDFTWQGVGKWIQTETPMIPDWFSAITIMYECTQRGPQLEAWAPCTESNSKSGHPKAVSPCFHLCIPFNDTGHPSFCPSQKQMNL